MIERLAERKDVRLFGCHYDDAPTHKNLFEDIKLVDVRDLKSICEFAGKVKAGAVISDQCDYSLLAQALVAEKFHLPGPSLESAQLSNNKFLQRTRSEHSGLRIPRFYLCATLKQARDAATALGYPIVLKPIDNRGSIGVAKVRSDEELDSAFYLALMNSHSRMTLLEEFIEGIHITVDGYAFAEHGNKSLALASKTLSPDGMQVALEIVYPGRLSQEMFTLAMKQNEEVNRSLNYEFGMTHSEYMVRGSEIFLIETSNRGGGVFTSEVIVPATSGVDLWGQYIADCLGEKVCNYNNSLHQDVMLKFFSFSPGKISAIKGWDLITSDTRVLKAQMFVKPGQVVDPITSDANRHGFIIFLGNPAEAQALLKNIEVIYETDFD